MPPLPRESSPARDPQATMLLDTDQNQPQGIFSSSSTNPRVVFPASTISASSIQSPCSRTWRCHCRVTSAVYVASSDLCTPQNQYLFTRVSAFYWGAWIALAIVLFLLTGVIVALVVGDDAEGDKPPSPAVSVITHRIESTARPRRRFATARLAFPSARWHWCHSCPTSIPNKRPFDH